ncbi:MAG: glycosyl transferase [Campylobacterota bacterium]|nr:glycosyl transferase [Campylobacterota bacterium]
MDFKTYIKAVGTGPKGNRDLTYDESKDMMTQILNATATPTQTAALLIGWRLKPETTEEFSGALSALDSFSVQNEIKNSIELGYPFDGKAKNPYLLPMICAALKSSELNLVIVGDELQPAKGGVTTKELYNSLDKLENLHFFDRKEYLQELHLLTDLRNILGLRSAFNTLEKLPNITNSQFAITGVHHKPYVKKYIEIFGSRYERFALIQGNEGTPELFKKGTLWIQENDTLSEEIVDPSFYDIKTDDLEGLAKLNAAILLYVSNKANSIGDAYESIKF